jgi:hypothetical protein
LLFEKLVLLLVNNSQQMQNLKQILAEKLKVLGESTTSTEKDDVMKSLNISMPTFYKYISGDVEKIGRIDTATDLVQLLSVKVNARIEKIRETNLA